MNSVRIPLLAITVLTWQACAEARDDHAETGKRSATVCNAALRLRHVVGSEPVSQSDACRLGTYALGEIAEARKTRPWLDSLVQDTSSLRDYSVWVAEVHYPDSAVSSKYWEVTFNRPDKSVGISVRVDRKSGRVTIGQSEPLGNPNSKTSQPPSP